MSETNFRKPLELGLKLAVTLRESYTSLQYHCRVGRTTIGKFVLKVCKAILHEFQKEYLICPTDPEEWKSTEEKFRNRWNVPHAVGALYGKYIAIRKPTVDSQRIFQLQGLLLPGIVGLCGCRMQISVGQRGGQWFIV